LSNYCCYYQIFVCLLIFVPLLDSIIQHRMTFKERTSEFNSIVQSVKQSKEGISSSVGIRSTKSKKVSDKSQFFVIASQIGRDIGETAEKLERLARLAKKKSLFDDPAIEISELTSIINQDIKNLTSQISTLQNSSTSSRRNKHLQKHTETVVGSLKHKLRHTTKDFTDILGIRTENLKFQQKEKENFTGSLSPSLTLGRRTAESPLYRNPQPLITFDDNSTGSDVVISMPQNALMTQERYVSNRTDAVVSIERTITELQGIFSQLANLVQEQGELINRIDHNVIETGDRVDAAQSELLKYLRSVSSNRWLIIKLFLVLVFFSVLFIVFFV